MVAYTDDPLIVRNAARASGELGVRFEPDSRADDGTPPAVVIVDLSTAGALGVVDDIKDRWPLTMVVGVLSQPSGDLWAEAEHHGCDVVTSRGALRKILLARVPAWMESPGGRRFRLFAVDEIAGRLGLVMRIAESPLGPLAVFHIGGQILAIEDQCPHAGAALSEGPVSLDDGVVTCPEHGSRFDTRSGARVRGPADDPILIFRVAVEDGTAYAEF
ncbi:MAG: Rieske 2Fe-2S domain-containing protein [Acidimicrobiia bacterium]|nr:Rieske 2Fe-2S domain-containing protein [Acidimicrobiia bacterium]